MAAPTVNVTVTLSSQAGLPYAGIVVKAKLDQNDIYQGFVISGEVLATTDAAGVATLALFPNNPTTGLGTTGSTYRFTATIPGGRRLDVTAQIPNANCTLASVADLSAVTGVSSSAAAASQAQASAVSATASAATATNQAGIATTQAGISTVQASTSTAQAATATTQATSATASRASIDGRIYPGAYVANPVTRPDGSAIQTGDRYVSSVDGLERIYGLGVWSTNASGTTAAITAANAASAASATAGAYPNAAATNVPRGLTQASVGAITPGASGTNGTFALAWAGGNFSINPTGTFTVAGGALTAVTITGPGLYIGAAPTVPTPSFAASASLAGAAVALIAQFLVTSGQGYWVQSVDGYTLTRYKNVSGVATSDAVVGPLGLQNLQSVAIDASTLQDTEVTTDTFGYVGARLTSQGRVGKAPASTQPLAYQGNVMHHFLDYGQSLSNGWNAVPVITTAGMFDDVWMFNGGVNTAFTSETAGVSMSSITPYFEQVQGSSGETPNGGRVGRFVQTLREKHGKSLRDAGVALLCSSAGKDGANITNLQKGSVYYTRIINQVTQGKALAIAAGYTYRFAGLFFDQGQYDNATAVATYLTALQQLQTDLQADIRAITGGTETVRFYLTTPWWDVGLAAPYSHPGATLGHLAAHAADSTKFILVAPPYAQNTIDGTHWPAFESGLAGAYGADAYMEEIIYGGKWQCVEPISFTVSGAVVTIRISSPSGQLVLDTNQVRKATAFGFLATDRNGTAYAMTADPAIVGADRVQFTLSAGAPASGLRVKYGDFSTQQSTWGYVGPLRRSYGNRGNLRDSSGDLAGGIYRHPSNRNSPLHRWCVQFDKVVIA
jgi:hypothetical protein